MKTLLRNRYSGLVYYHLAALLCIALTTLVLKPIESYLEIQFITLLYLLPVMVSTVLWGLTPGILAGFLAFLAVNYFFIQPYYTFKVHATQDLITLIIFLVVAVVMSQLIGKAQAGVRLARQREWEATRMYELISALAGLQDPASIARVLANHTQETFQFMQVEVVIDSIKGSPLITAAAPGLLPGQDQQPMRIPIKTARRQEAAIWIWHPNEPLSTEETRLLDACLSQAALALERTRLAKSETKARVLEESDRLKSSMLNSVSHELRSPLAAIKTSVSSLRSGVVDWDTAARQELLETIEEETDDLNLLVGNLLDMSRIESGALKPQRKWNSIAEIALGIAAKMRSQLHNHRLEIDLPEELPLVPTDYIMIGQVFTNLISNSIKYAPVGTTIKINASRESDCLHVQVINQSPAVPEEHLERIFDKFYRITEADRVTGTGLGLSICKGIIEAHGGKIWAKNQANGFGFHFTLPLDLDGALPEFPEEGSDG